MEDAKLGGASQILVPGEVTGVQSLAVNAVGSVGPSVRAGSVCGASIGPSTGGVPAGVGLILPVNRIIPELPNAVPDAAAAGSYEQTAAPRAKAGKAESLDLWNSRDLGLRCYYARDRHHSPSRLHSSQHTR